MDHTFLKPCSSFNPYGVRAVPSKTKNVLKVYTSWTVTTLSENNVSWKLPIFLEVDTSWEIEKVLSVNTSYALLQSLETDVSWKLPIYLEVDTSYKIIAILETDTTWKLPIYLLVDTSYALLQGLFTDTSWYIQKLLQQETSYTIYITIDYALSWMVKEELSVFSAYRLQPAMEVDVSWEVNKLETVDISWQVKSSPKGNISWKILDSTRGLPGVNYHTVLVTVDSTEIDPVSISLNNDIDSLAWAANLVLSTQADYDLCVDGAVIVITIDTVVWTLIVKQRDTSQSFPTGDWTIEAISIFATVAEEQVSLVLEADTLASEIGAVVVGNEVTLNWNTLNWVLPDELKIAENNTRKSILSSLAEAIGSIIVSKPNGELCVRYGTSIDDAIAEEWTNDNVVTINKDVVTQKVYNRVLIGSEGLYIPRNISISVVEKDDVERYAKLAVTIAPKPITPTVIHCSSAGIHLRYNTFHTETITESVVFKDGVASIATIETLVSVDWGDCTSLGTVEIVGDGILLASTVGDSIAEVEYTTKYYEYLLTADGTDEITTMVCASVDPVRSDLVIDCQRDSGILSPEVITHKFCTTTEAAMERGRVYLDTYSGDIVTYNVSKIWDGSILPEIGSSISYDTEVAQLTALSIDYSFPSVSLSATLEVIKVPV